MVMPLHRGVDKENNVAISPAIKNVLGLGVFPDHAIRELCGIEGLLDKTENIWAEEDAAVDNDNMKCLYFPYSLPHTDGSTVHVEVGSTRVMNGDGVPHFLLVVRDITDRIKHQKVSCTRTHTTHAP
jgi:hypothetical protein